MKAIFTDLDLCTREEALNLIASIIFYYSSIFSQSFNKSIEEITETVKKL